MKPVSIQKSTQTCPYVRHEQLNKTSSCRCKKICDWIKNFPKTVILTIQKIWRYMASHVGHKTRCVLHDDQLLDRYNKVLDKKNPETIRRMKKEYARDHGKVQDVAYGAGVPGGAAAGAGIGAGFGAIGGPIGAGIGAGIGAIVGAISGAVGAKMSLDCHYESWERKNVNESNKQALIDFHKDHEEMAIFCCPISGEFMRDPVVTPYGDVYERSSIESHITAKLELIEQDPTLELCILDPQRKGPIQIEDLKKDYPTILKMHKAYSDLVEQGQELQNLKPVVKAGFLALKKDLDKQVKALMDRIIYMHTPRYVNNIMKNPEGVNMFLDDQQEIAELTSQIGKHGTRNLRISLAAAMLRI